MAFPSLKNHLRAYQLRFYRSRTEFVRNNDYSLSSNVDVLFSKITNRNVMETAMNQLFDTLLIISCFPSQQKEIHSSVDITRQGPVAEMDAPRKPLDDPRFVKYSSFPSNIRIMIDDALLGYGSQFIAKEQQVLGMILCHFKRINERKKYEIRVVFTHWYRKNYCLGLYDENALCSISSYLPHLEVNRRELWLLIKRYKMITKFGCFE
eukprot:180104_1